MFTNLLLNSCEVLHSPSYKFAPKTSETLLFPYSCLQYPVLMQFCFKLFTILDKKWEGNELRCFGKRGVTLLQNSTLALSSLWLICNLQSLFSLPFREVRECLKLDQDHKDCFPFYKVKQHFPSLRQIDLKP